MKKKKLTMLLLTMTLSALPLTGCGSGAGQTTSQPSSAAASAETAPPETAAEPPVTDGTSGNARTALNTLYPLPTATEDAGIYVEPIPDLADDFIRGR